MAAGTYDITIEQGTTWTQPLLYQDNQVPPEPIDLTGYSARMQVRETIPSGSILVELTTANGKIVLGDEDGTIVLSLDDAETAALAFTTGVYDLELESAGGVVTRLLKGSVTIDPEVTR